MTGPTSGRQTLIDVKRLFSLVSASSAGSRSRTRCGGRFVREVVVRITHRVTDLERLPLLGVANANRVIKDDNLFRSGLLQQEVLDFRVVDGSHFLTIREVRDLCAAPAETEALGLEVELIGQKSAVLDGDLSQFVGTGLRIAAASTIAYLGQGRLTCVDGELHDALNRICRDHIHSLFTVSANLAL